MTTLDYEHRQQPPPPNGDRAILAWLSGLLPPLVLFGAFYDNAVTGDPVDSVTRFTAYHYVSGGIFLLLLLWFIAVLRSSSRRWSPIVCVVALLWVGLNGYGTYLFIDDVRTDAASSYYFSIWRPFGWLGWR